MPKRLFALGVRLIILLYIIISTPLTLPISLILYAVRKDFLVRIGCFTRFHQEALGHWVVDSSILIARAGRRPKVNNGFDIYYYEPSIEICNQYWRTLISRHLRFAPWYMVIGIHYWIRNIASLNQLNILMPVDENGSRDINGELSSVPCRLCFNTQETQNAEHFFRYYGLAPNTPYICLLVRDSAYKGSSGVQGTFSIRNSNIEDFRDLAIYCIERGIAVIRMGKKTSNRLNLASRLFIDYSLSPLKSDFLDVWLFANCLLCVSTAAGADSISDVFRRPILYINHTIPELLTSWSYAIHSFKIFRWARSNAMLSLTEMLNLSWWSNGISTQVYDQNNIVFESIPPKVMASICEEAILKINGKWEITSEEKLAQERFFAILNEHPNFQKYNLYRHENASISYGWLKYVSEQFLY